MEISESGTRRFDWIAAGRDIGPNPQCDVPVLSSSRAIVVPTIGSILPNWVLSVPRTCALSLARLDPVDRRAVLELADQAAYAMGPAEDAVYFEHGPASDGSAIGCGVDQAHLHVLSSKLNFIRAALEDPDVSWEAASPVDPWACLGNSEYYFIRTGQHAFVGHPQKAISQFFRRHIAVAAGVSECWDYKLWPNYNNIRRTYEQFNGRVSASGK